MAGRSRRNARYTELRKNYRKLKGKPPAPGTEEERFEKWERGDPAMRFPRRAVYKKTGLQGARRAVALLPFNLGSPETAPTDAAGKAIWFRRGAVSGFAHALLLQCCTATTPTTSLGWGEATEDVKALVPSDVSFLPAVLTPSYRKAGSTGDERESKIREGETYKVYEERSCQLVFGQRKLVALASAKADENFEENAKLRLIKELSTTDVTQYVSSGVGYDSEEFLLEGDISLPWIVPTTPIVTTAIAF